MNPRSILVAGASMALVLIAIALLWPSPEDPGDAAREPAVDRSATAPSAARAVAETDPRPIESAAPRSASLEQAEAAVASARSEHQRAQAALVDAEDELADIEHALEDVERFVDDLVERGDDPAKHAFEGMERLNPVIEQYEAKMQVIEEAEALEADTQRALDEAEKQLDALRGQKS